MTRIVPLILAAMLALPAQAQSIDDMDDAERQAFRAEVRDYLLEHPEVLMEAISVLEERQASEAAARDLQLVARFSDELFAAEHDLIEGNPDGDITIVEFLDYRCSFCRRAAPEVTSLLEEDGNIRLVIKELPILGPESVLASRFALATRYAVDEEAYSIMHEALMVMRADVSEASLVRLANDLGYDGAAIAAQMIDPRIDAVIEANYDLARSLQITGTPTFVLGSQLIRGFLPGSEMAQVIQEERLATQ